MRSSYISKIIFLLDRQQRVSMLVIFFMMVVGAVLEAVGLGLIFPFIALLSDPDILQKKNAFVWLYNFMGLTSFRQFVMCAVAVFLLINILKNLYLALFYFYQFKFISRLQHSLSSKLLKAYLSAPYTFHLQRNSAQLLKNVTFEVSNTCQYVVVPTLSASSELVVVLSLLAVLLTMNPVGALVAVIGLGSVATLFVRGFNKKFSRMGNMVQRSNEKMIQWVNQSLGGIKEVKVLGRASFFANMFSQHSSEHARGQALSQGMYQLPRLITEVLAVLGMMLIIVVGLASGQGVAELTPGLALFGMAAFRLMPSGNRIMGTLSMIPYYTPALNAVCEDICRVDSIKEGPFVYDSSMDVNYDGGIEVKKLSYTYPDSHRKALDNVSVRIDKNTSVAFVGPSGAGKSTFLDILLGLLIPSSGDITINGKSIYKSIPCWQKKFGYIPQSIFLTDDTVCKNIAFGLDDNQIDKNRVWETLKMVQLDSFVRDLPDGLDTFVGERGIRLSGGQRQRIGIARALYYDPDILVLDEATSSLDHEVEREIMWAVDNWGGKKTIIIVAHRITTVKNCDKIYLLKNGKMIGNVAYEDLVRSVGDAQPTLLNS